MLTSTGKHSIAASARSQFFGRDFESANGAYNPCIVMKVAVLENTTSAWSGRVCKCSSNVVWELWLAAPPNTISQLHKQLHLKFRRGFAELLRFERSGDREQGSFVNCVLMKGVVAR